ncbi:MAG: hypothetical protein RL885_20225 [Planctomycetota bacterium]
MPRDRVSEVSDDHSFIPGIHNYCDRWCERCTLKHRCETPLTRTRHDTCAKSDGLVTVTIAVPTPDALIAMAPFPRQRRLLDLAKDYAIGANVHLEQAGPTLDKLRKDLPAPERPRLDDAVAVLCWYSVTLFAKLGRAVGQCSPAILRKGPHVADDVDGSAKVALLGIDRSLRAWADLRRMGHRDSPGPSSFRRDLRKLRARVLAEFPNAPRFHRPGFDEPSAEESS